METKSSKKQVVKTTAKNTNKKSTVKKSTSKKTNSKLTSAKPTLNKIPMVEVGVVDANNISYVRPFENQHHTPSRTQVFREEISSLKKLNLESDQEIKNLIQNNEILEEQNKKNETEILNFKNRVAKLEHDLNDSYKKNQNLVNELNTIIANNKNLKNQLSQLEENNKILNEQFKNVQTELKSKINVEQEQTPPPPSNNGPKPENWESIKNQLEKQIIQLNKALEDERQQMINKLQIKSKEAQKLVDDKLDELEKKKQDELAQLKSKVNEEVICQFLDPILLLDQTIESSANNSAIYNYLQGFKMIVNMFKDKLSMLGTEEIVVNVGDTFNENWMAAFDAIHDPKYPPNIVLKVVSKGYALKGKVIKYTSVVVSK